MNLYLMIMDLRDKLEKSENLLLIKTEKSI
jgi:hypothetical protein